MLARRSGRRLSAAAKRKTTGRRQSGKPDTLSPKERADLLRLLACGSVFVLLVAAKLLLPGKMTGLENHLAAAMRRSVDVQAVFSAVGDLFTRERTPSEAAEDVYQAVFHPETAEASQTAAENAGSALTELRSWRQTPAGEAALTDGTDDTLAESATELVLYADEDLPQNVSMRQVILGFDHQTPVKGTLSSGFGYREHPTAGEERFHYGVDLAADTGTPIACFADGTVTAVGESSSYGTYCTVAHDNGCVTLYAHCSQITVSSGETVQAGGKLGEVGETGMATGPHLHFELQKDGIYLNPVYYVETA